MGVITTCALFCFVVAIAIASYRSHRFRSDDPEQDSRRESARSPQSPLRRVHPRDPEIKTDIDIVAIHGLDTKSPDTWEFKGKDGKKSANWLEDNDMLPSEVGNARIFTCDWPTHKFESPEIAKLHIEELAQRLVAHIKAELLSDEKDRPLVFIASCFGGIILMKALTDSIEDDPLRSSTRAVIFLATPFDGTSFGKIAYWVRPLLSVQAWIRGAIFSPRHDYVEGGMWQMSEMTLKFGQLCLAKGYLVSAFYETVGTNLLAKNLPRALQWISKEELLVDKRSATPVMKDNMMPLVRAHTRMNKFPSPDDEDYRLVANTVRDSLERIREGRPLEKIDRELKRYYEDDNRLYVERLSTDRLPMEQCYINLAIIEQIASEDGVSSKFGGSKEISPFSLAPRLGVVEDPDDVRLELPDIFKQRAGRQAPRKVLIRGRAGIGKTTLCKKMVYDFIHGDLWNETFDRIFWLPLRDLKIFNFMVNDIEDLFRKIYLSGETGLAHAAWVALNKSNYSKTLFVLDGLDEVFDELHGEQKIIKLLMKLPNIIVTSRPHVSLPTWLDETQKFHLELETIGFYPDQVASYVRNHFIQSKATSDTNNPDAILSFLETHQLMKSLMRIPILLDALCWTWSGFESQSTWHDLESDEQTNRPQTMTDIYQAVELKLWTKDLEKLDKIKPGQRRFTLPDEYRSHVEVETEMLEHLAFSGMYSNIVNFEPRHRNRILVGFKLDKAETIDERLSKLSFLRASGIPANAYSSRERRTYHFLHLTFQEYFAARYFFRQWKDKKNLEFFDLVSGNQISMPTDEFLGRNKYKSRYDIPWRFVAGLMSDHNPKELERFFKSLDREPLDRLGAVHQRLLMHCLSESKSDFSLRSQIESHLSQWLIFQCKFMVPVKRIYPARVYKFHTLATEIEFPQQALTGLWEECDEAKMVAYDSMKWLIRIAPQFRENLISFLDTESVYAVPCLIGLLKQSNEKLPESVLRSIVSRLWTESGSAAAVTIAARNPEWAEQEVRSRSILARDYLLRIIDQTLQRHEPSEKLLREILDHLEKMDVLTQKHAITFLVRQSTSSKQFQDEITDKLLGESFWDVRHAANKFLHLLPTLPPKVVEMIEARIKIDNNPKNKLIRNRFLAKPFARRSELPERLTRLLSTMVDENIEGSNLAVDILCCLTNCPDGLPDRLILKDNWLKYARSFIMLCNRSKLSSEALDALQHRLVNPVSTAREILLVLKILNGKPGLSDAMLQAIVSHLKHEDPRVRTIAVSALSGQPCLSQEIVRGITDILDEPLKKGNIKQGALQVLKQQTTLQIDILGKIADSIMKDENPEIKAVAIDTLTGNPYLSESPDLLKELASYIDPKGSGFNVEVTGPVIAAAVQALGLSGPLILENNLEIISSQLNHDDKMVRKVVVQVLIDQSSLSEKHLTLLVDRTNDDDRDVRKAVVQFLLRQPSHSEEHLRLLMTRINDEDSGIRNDIVQFILRQSPLSDDYVQLLATRINDQDWEVRSSVGKFLEEQKDLTDETLHIIASQIAGSDTVRFADPMRSFRLVNMLLKHERLHSELLLRGFAYRVLSPLLLRSFKAHLAWYIQDGESCLETESEIKRRGLFADVNIEVEMNTVREAAQMPPVAVFPVSHWFHCP
ncbi:unnamed protein product [Penicillium salamii]|nr:unnamed protein product [Penicillium salamii]CAG8011684.1 unnamed protein product [Penicillium salamii]CAG8367096.1 unnamed protein product [Penicillium salamii]